MLYGVYDMEWNAGGGGGGCSDSTERIADHTDHDKQVGE